MSSTGRIAYLDHNSGGRVRPEVAETVTQALREGYGNPSSQHRAGRAARGALEAARDDVAALVGAQSEEIIFTSGGTEANNLAILGMAGVPAAHVLVAPIEHASVLRACDRLSALGFEVEALPVGADGGVSVDDVVGRVRPDTRLISLGWANGEIGVVQEMATIVGAIQAMRETVSPMFHSDAVQAAGLIEIHMARDAVDAISLSAHKLGGLSGVGALVVRSGCPLAASLVGGPQERERRAGTENLIGIIAFGAAARLARVERAAVAGRLHELRERLWLRLQDGLRPTVRLSPAAGGLPNTLSVSWPGLRGDAMIIALDLAGVAASTGAACAAGAAEPSHVLRAIGCDEATAQGAVRLSLGPDATAPQIDHASRVIVETVGAALLQVNRANRPASTSVRAHAA